MHTEDCCQIKQQQLCLIAPSPNLQLISPAESKGKGGASQVLQTPSDRAPFINMTSLGPVCPLCQLRKQSHVGITLALGDDGKSETQTLGSVKRSFLVDVQEKNAEKMWPARATRCPVAADTPVIHFNTLYVGKQKSFLVSHIFVQMKNVENNPRALFY